MFCRSSVVKLVRSGVSCKQLPVVCSASRVINVPLIPDVQLSGVNLISCRSSVTCTSLLFRRFGEPVDVVEKHDETLEFSPSTNKDKVLIKMLAAPVHPADINTIQGVYAIKPELPFVIGNEGVAEVTEVGADVSSLKVGDRVIPKSPSWGTWRSHAVVSPKDFIQVPSDIDTIVASTIASSPGTAYRMLKDYVDMKPDDVVIQSGANSAVGQAAIQIAKALGLKSINVVRDRPDIQELKKYLTDLGATVVVTEKELQSDPAVKDMDKPKLALDCVSGKLGIQLMRSMQNGGVMVIYGGMSRKPMTVPVSSLIFSNMTLTGFWLTRWRKNNLDNDELDKMCDELFEMARKGLLCAPRHALVPLNDFKMALENTMTSQGMVGKKQILMF